MTDLDAPQIKNHPLNKAAVALLKRFGEVPVMEGQMPVVELAWTAMKEEQQDDGTGAELSAASQMNPQTILAVLAGAVDAEEVESADSIEEAGQRILEILTESPVNLDSDLARLDDQEAARLRQQGPG